MKEEDQYLGSLGSNCDLLLARIFRDKCIYHTASNFEKHIGLHGFCILFFWTFWTPRDFSQPSSFKSMPSELRLAHKTTKCTFNCDTFNTNNLKFAAPYPARIKLRNTIPDLAIHKIIRRTKIDCKSLNICRASLSQIHQW